jgi:hypothetical protein
MDSYACTHVCIYVFIRPRGVVCLSSFLLSPSDRDNIVYRRRDGCSRRALHVRFSFDTRYFHIINYRMSAFHCFRCSQLTLDCTLGMICLGRYCFMICDRTRRTGVSVLLSCELLKPCVPGQTVIVTSKADKIGKTLGFCSMSIFSESGEMLARGVSVI